MTAARFLVGTSGWSYSHWRGPFYPEDLPRDQWLAYYARHFPTTEVNATFYRQPRPSTWDGWRQHAPPGFVYAVKAHQLITHRHRLHHCEAPLAAFVQGARRLGAALGPVLFQLPPGLHRNDELLAAFLALLPPDLQPAFEFRHASWYEEPVFALLRGRAAVVVHDWSEQPPHWLRTAPWVYLRFHGPTGRYYGGYDDAALADWAARARDLADGANTLYAYFNNDAGGHAVHDALRFTALLSRP